VSDRRRSARPPEPASRLRERRDPRQPRR